MGHIYLDFNASTPIAPEVAAAMQPFLTEHYGNPSSLHWAGYPAREAVERARGQVASLLECDPTEVIFTSGGSEANNLAIKGVFDSNRSKGGHIITSAIEHPSVLETCRFLITQGAKLTILPVDRFGRVDIEGVKAAITPETVLITVMHANNEVGTIEPIKEIAGIARDARIPFHSDGAQSVGKIPTPVEALGTDLFSIAGHKLYGPKGIGALMVREGTSLTTLIHGAGHEGGRRAGTENVLGIVGLGAACALAQDWKGADQLAHLADRFWHSLKDAYDEKISLNGHPVHRLPNTLNINFISRIGAELLATMPEVAASTGAACHSGSVELSPVLAAMGVPPIEGMGAIRFSLGRTTTWDELREVIDLLEELVPPQTDHDAR